jgi:hypothetical protein
MKKIPGLLLAALLLAAPLAGSARAEKIDFGKITCEEYMKTDGGDQAYFYFWLDGYVSAKTNDTVLDTEAVGKDVQALTEMCQANPGKTVLEVIGQK